MRGRPRGGSGTRRPEALHSEAKGWLVGAAYGFHVLTAWTEPANDRRLMEWTDDFHDAMVRHAAGGVSPATLEEASNSG